MNRRYQPFRGTKKAKAGGLHQAAPRLGAGPHQNRTKKYICRFRHTDRARRGPSEPKAKSYLYPSEDEKLLGCTRISLLNRVYYGFIAREGLRSSEARRLRILDVDLIRGM